uniref:Zinc finger C2HC domain-containing protein 1A n=1 Tax=Branchiostoma floridae TaxID=7739 RepID=C3ZSP4_BRAFL|eukprot:XP_002588435.1 hypothetical protein BRAFLDRAFT_63383 [Branchiostoma floridae]
MKEKHGRICRKNAQKKRKVFDSGRMRAQGTDIPVNKTLRTQPLGTQPKTKNDVSKQTNPVKQSKWRQQHEEFIRSIRAAKETDVAIKTGKPLPPPPPPVVNPDYVQCPHCERRFNEAAAERHIPKCADMKKRMPNKNVADAKARTNARTQYRAPLPGKKKPAAANSATRMTSTANSAQSRGVSSGYGQQASSGYGMQNGSKRTTGGSTLTNGSSPSSARSTGYRGSAQSGYQGPAAGGKGSSLASQTENPASQPARNDTHSQSVSVDDSNKPASQSGSAALSQQVRKSGRSTPILVPTFQKPIAAQKGKEVKSPSPTVRTPSPKGADIAFPRLMDPNPDEDMNEDPLASSSKFIALTSEEGELSHPVPLLPKLDLSGLKTPPRTPRKGRPSLLTKKGKSHDQPPKITKPLLTTRGEEVVNLQSTKKRFAQTTMKSPMRPQPLNSKLSPSQKESDSDRSCPTQLAPRGTKEKAVLAITPPSTPMAPKGNKEKAVIAITPPSTPMAPRGTKEKAVLAITPPSTPMAPRACLTPLATRACPTPLAPRACPTPLSPRASLTPLSPRACLTPLSPRASPTPLAPRECPTPLAPRGNSVVTPPYKIRPVSQIDQEVPSPTPAIKKPLLTPRGNIKAQTVINRTGTTGRKQKRYFTEQPKVQCPTCPLKLIRRAAERHIPVCEDKHRRLGEKKPPAKAFQQAKKARTKVVAVHVDKQPNIGLAKPKPHSMALSLAEEEEKEEDAETTRLKNSRFTQSSEVESQAGTTERKQKRYFTEQPKVQCPHCLIKLIPGSAERHISFCEEKHRRLGEKKPPAKAKRMVEVSKGKAKVVAALHLDDQLNSGQAAPKLHSMALCLDEEGEKEKDAATNKLKNSRVTSWSAEENKAGITEPKQKRYFSEQVRVQCPYCPIKMLPEVAKRHIAFCEEKHRRLGEKKTPAKTKRTAEIKVSKGKAKVVPAKPKPYSVALCLDEEGEQDKDGDAAKVKKSRITSRSVVESEAGTTGYKQKRYYTEQPRVQCPHCPIKLKETSLPEHVKFCAEVHARLENKNRGKTKKQTKKGLNKTAILQELTEEPCSQKRYNPPWGPNYVYCPYCFLKIDAMSAREHIPSCRADQEERLAEKKIPAKPKLSKEMEAIAPSGRSKKTKSASRIPIPIRKPLLTARSNIFKAPKGKKLCPSPLKSNIPPAEGDAQGLLSMQKSNAAEKETSHEPFVSKATVAAISCSTNGKGKRELPSKQADTVQKNLLATAHMENESLTSPSDNMKPEAAVSTLSCSTNGTGKRELPTKKADTVDKDLDTTARVDGQPNTGQPNSGQAKDRERESDVEATKVQKSLISQRSLEENKGGTTEYRQKQCYSEQPRVECPHCHIKVKEGSLSGHMMFCGDVHSRLENKIRGKTEKQAKKALSEIVIRQQLANEPRRQKCYNSQLDLNYVQCPNCSLKMNAMLAMEHIPFCDGVQHPRLGEKKTEATIEGTVTAETKISKGKKQDGYKKEAIAPPWTLASPKHNRGMTLPNKTRPSSRIPITIRKSLLTPRSNMFMAQTGKKVSASALTSNAPQPPADGGHRMLMMQKSNSVKKEISRAPSENIKAKAVTTLSCSTNGKGKRELPTHQHDTVQEDLNTTPHIGAKVVAVCVDDQPNSGQAMYGEAAALSKNSQIPAPQRSVEGDNAGTTKYKQKRWSTYQPKVQCPHCPTRVKEAFLPWHLESCAGVYALQEIKNREKTKKQAKKALSETEMRQHLTQEPSKKRHHSLPSDPIVKYGFIYDCHGQVRPAYRKSTEHVKASTGYLSSPLEMEMDSPWPRGDSPLSAYSRLPEIPSARDSLSTLTPEIPSEREETAMTLKQRIEAFGNRAPPTYGFPWPECERLLLTTRLPAIPEEREEPDGTLTQGPETRERGLPTPIEEIPLSERLDLHYTQCPNCLIKMTVSSAIDHIPSCTPRRGNSGLMGGMNSRTPTPPSVGRGRPPSGPSSASRRNRGSAGSQQTYAANHMSGNSRYDDYDHEDYQSTGDLPERLTQAMRLGSTENIAGKTASKFCHECGTRYPIPNAKFCCECGTRRIWLM